MHPTSSKWRATLRWLAFGDGPRTTVQVVAEAYLVSFIAAIFLTPALVDPLFYFLFVPSSYLLIRLGWMWWLEAAWRRLRRPRAGAGWTALRWVLALAGGLLVGFGVFLGLIVFCVVVTLLLGGGS